MRTFFLAVLAMSVPVAGHAHKVWIERDGNGPACIYLGEPAEPQPTGSDPEFAKLERFLTVLNHKGIPVVVVF